MEKSDLRFLKTPAVRIQPILAREGVPSIDPEEMRKHPPPEAELMPLITIRDRMHWESVIRSIPDDIDVITLLSNPCYPTEIWNENPEPLRQRGLPVLFWPLLQYDEPDFWKWSCSDMLRSLGVEVELSENQNLARVWLKALAFRKFLKRAKMLSFGKQNFPWNADSASGGFRNSLGMQIQSVPCSIVEERMKTISPDSIRSVIQFRLADSIQEGVSPDELEKAVAYYLGLREILIERQAFAFGVNCFGDVIPRGMRIVPCLAQQLAREDGFSTGCDGDFCAIIGLAMLEKITSQPAMMSNLYPLAYRGALIGHFGDPLDCDSRWRTHSFENMARLAHCGFAGVVPPPMTPSGKVRLRDWGGTYEIKRDGRGCGIDGELRGGQTFTVIEPKFDGKTLLITRGTVLETTRHAGMPHCESSVLLEFENLPAFIRNISREHIALVYGDWIPEIQTAARVLGMHAITIAAGPKSWTA